MTSARILLVEDDAEDARLIVGALDRFLSAPNILLARDGAAALDLLNGAHLGRQPPRLVLLDLEMPRVSGLEVLERIRAAPQLGTTPVVVLTSSRDAPGVQRAYELGANSYLCKPLELDEFVRVVRQVGLYWMVLNETPS